MNKIADVVFVIIGIISLVGTVFVMWGISVLDSAISQVTSLDASTVSSLGLNPTSTQALARQFKWIASLGWIWSTLVFIASLGIIYFAVADLRRQRSIVVRKR